VTTLPNVPVTFQAVCTDTGPAYEQTEVLEFNDTNPMHGTLTQEFAGDPFTYTPNSGFIGTDSFKVQSFDALGFGSDTGVITLTVKAPQGNSVKAKKCKKKKKKKHSASAAKKKCKKKKGK
jgi:hypothetical protein